MKSNRNRIIRVLALALAACSLLCACNKAESDKTSSADSNSESATETVSATELTTELTTEFTTAEPSTEPSVTQTTTAEQTTAAVTMRPTTTKPVSTAAPNSTVKPTETTTKEHTKAPLETTTRHSNPIANAANTAGKIISYRLISKDEIKTVASEIADTSEIYYVRLNDGTNTYYMAVDLQTAQAIALSNPRVLRELCKQLDEKQKQMADKDTEYVLMDYTHLVGELEVHYLGYLLTGALGAEDGPLASFYRSCSVADLNIDEARFGPIIAVIGVIYG